MGLFRPRRGKSAGAGGNEPDDAELVLRMRLGDETALEELYARYGGLVYTLALRIVGDPELAREVLQDTFLRSWDGREAYNPGRGKLPWWLMGIARNRAIDLLRSRPHQARLKEQERLGRGAHASEERNTEQMLHVRRVVTDALRGLSTVQREAIELAYYSGLTQAEIARELGQPLGTIKSRTREAMERLRHALQPLMDPQEGRGKIS
jgi:RNA polymerase sigma-70 factor (ECF subfamily)